jgi:L-amino acid N-acyltransferase YncA
LALIANRDGVCSYDDLAQELGVSRALLEPLLDELLRSGCLRRADGEGAADGCESCPVHSTCGTTGGARFWEVTEKGRRWLAQPREAASHP